VSSCRDYPLSRTSSDAEADSQFLPDITGAVITVTLHSGSRIEGVVASMSQDGYPPGLTFQKACEFDVHGTPIASFDGYSIIAGDIASWDLISSEMEPIRLPSDIQRK
jgi:hypothetical protein